MKNNASKLLAARCVWGQTDTQHEMEAADEEWMAPMNEYTLLRQEKLNPLKVSKDKENNHKGDEIYIPYRQLIMN